MAMIVNLAQTYSKGILGNSNHDNSQLDTLTWHTHLSVVCGRATWELEVVRETPMSYDTDSGNDATPFDDNHFSPISWMVKC